jgi:hypothetical protein
MTWTNDTVLAAMSGTTAAYMMESSIVTSEKGLEHTAGPMGLSTQGISMQVFDTATAVTYSKTGPSTRASGKKGSIMAMENASGQMGEGIGASGEMAVLMAMA